MDGGNLEDSVFLALRSKENEVAQTDTLFLEGSSVKKERIFRRVEVRMKEDILDTSIPVLGKPKVPSPIASINDPLRSRSFVSDNERILLNILEHEVVEGIEAGKKCLSFERAGPRKRIYFDPSKLRCAIVTCGGLCPGINDIIRAIVLELYHVYKVKNIVGIRYGLQGFIPKYGHDVIELTPDIVSHIHEMGGTILGSSRGPQDIGEIVDALERMNVGLLFAIGGDGTLKAATRIVDEILERGLKISVIGIPKTIDNDIYMVERSFGFSTAVEVATHAIRSAHIEALGFPNGIGLLKLMGRNSGFIAATATLALRDVNFVLIPESDFDLEGPNGLLEALKRRLLERKHAVIVVAEGAGQKFFGNNKEERDASGNIRLKDIGQFLKDAILEYFNQEGMEVNLKYIDPSYMIRSLPANTSDNIFCGFLGQSAVHAGMAGKTKMLVSSLNNHLVHVPMHLSAGRQKRVDLKGKLWLSVLETTGQPSLKNERDD